MTTLLPTQLLALLLSASVSMAEGLHTRIEEPRAFGHMVGDTVERHIAITASRPLALNAESLPKAGRLGYALELRRVNVASEPVDGGTQYRLDLRYQIFVAPTEAKTLDLPAFVLSFDGGARPEELRIDFAPVTVAPLTPPGQSPRRGLGVLRPDIAAPLVDASAVVCRLVAYGGLAFLLLAYVAYVYLGPWLLAKRRRPFTHAYRNLRRLRAARAEENFPAAMKHLHRAFNDTAGGTVFRDSVDNFLADHPRFAPLRAEITCFFDQSRQTFFAADKQVSAQDLCVLTELCRTCRDIERGAA